MKNLHIPLSGKHLKNKQKRLKEKKKNRYYYKSKQKTRGFNQ